MRKKGLHAIAVFIGSALLVSCGSAGNDGSSTDTVTDTQATATAEVTEVDAEGNLVVVDNSAEETEETSEPVYQEITQEGVDIHITEKMYTTYINELYTNTEDYLGKTVQIEGIYMKLFYEETGNDYYYVYREGPGCCATDTGMVGLEFIWPEGTSEEEMLLDDEWVRVIGVLESYNENGVMYLTLRDAEVTVMEQRGLEVLEY